MRRAAKFLMALALGIGLSAPLLIAAEGEPLTDLEKAATLDFSAEPLFYVMNLEDVLHEGVATEQIQPTGAWAIFDDFSQSLIAASGPVPDRYATYIHQLSNTTAREAHFRAAKRTRLARRQAALQKVESSDSYTTAPFAGVE